MPKNKKRDWSKIKIDYDDGTTTEHKQKCRKCGDIKPYTEFRHNKRHGLETVCRSCVTEQFFKTKNARAEEGTTGWSKSAIAEKHFTEAKTKYEQYFDQQGVCWVNVIFKFGTELFFQTKDKLKSDGFKYHKDTKTWRYAIPEGVDKDEWTNEYFSKHQWVDITITDEVYDNGDHFKSITINSTGGYLGDIVEESIDDILKGIENAK